MAISSLIFYFIFATFVFVMQKA